MSAADLKARDIGAVLRLDQPLKPDTEYFDATEHMQVMAQKIADLQNDVGRLSDLVERIATMAAGTQKRQVEMRAELLAAGAFEKQSAIIMPGRGYAKAN